MNCEKNVHCADGHEELSVNRRDFVKVVGGAAVTTGVGGWLTPQSLADKKSAGAETTVKQLYDSLTEKQRQAVCFASDDPKQSRISANWSITDPTIDSDFYTPDQQKLIEGIFRGITSKDGHERFLVQMDDDWGGFGSYTMALFGEPGSDRFQWVMTGRHLTIRADGNRQDKVAFGGPVVYGHGESSPKKNLFHYQTRKANAVFEALDPKQREKALLAKAPKESRVPLQGAQGKFPGVGIGELSGDQRGLVEEVIQGLLAPYREQDVAEAMAVLKAGGGLEKLHMAFYQQGDLEDDRVWDIWRVEGPSFVWHFRGAPHVHTYVNIGVQS